MKKLRLAALAVLALALPMSASAVCLLCVCTVSTTPVAFGSSYSPLSGSAALATGNVAVRCTTTLGLLVTFSVDLDKGSNSASFSPRKMASGGNRLNYDLYTSAAYTTPWGDGTSGTGNFASSASLTLLSATTINIPVYGRIPANQTTVPPGSYADSVAVTLTYN